MATAFNPGFEGRATAQARFDETARQHRVTLRACARRLLQDDAEADALVEEVLAAAPLAFALFRPTGSLGCWLQGVTVGAALARRRASREADDH